MKYVDFTNEYCIDYTQEVITDNDDKLREIYIDGYPEDPNEEGTVIATVVLTKHRDLIINWHDNGYKMNDTVNNLIQESIATIKDDSCWRYKRRIGR